jgi:hypothetical protein
MIVNVQREGEKEGEGEGEKTITALMIQILQIR